MNSNLTRLEKFFSSLGFTTPDIPLLQPTEPFLDTAGEELRRRIFITSDQHGHNLCLRPEFTIPVCLAHLVTGKADGKYAYGGSVFRQGKNSANEFTQAGLEMIGGQCNAQTDVSCITTAVDALAHCGETKLRVVLGDQAVFEALLCALKMPAAWQARLGRAFGDGGKLDSDLQLMGDSNGWALSDVEATLRAALTDNNMDGVETFIAEKMHHANLPAHGGRTAHDITKRLMAKAELATSFLSDEQRQLLKKFLSLDVNLEDASKTLTAFAATANLDLGSAMAMFSQRAELLLAKKPKDCDLIWRANFGRALDYYTGMVFEIHKPDGEKPICGGGRYDRLMGMLGAPVPVPAIGFSIWLDRLERPAS